MDINTIDLNHGYYLVGVIAVTKNDYKCSLNSILLYTKQVKVLGDIFVCMLYKVHESSPKY